MCHFLYILNLLIIKDGLVSALTSKNELCFAAIANSKGMGSLINYLDLWDGDTK